MDYTRDYPLLLGAVAGDIIGSVYEWNNTKRTDFELFSPDADFTDDTVLTIAIAHAILYKKDFAETVWKYGNKYPDRGYGGLFQKWLSSLSMTPYNSYGNGSAMRVSPVGLIFNTIEEVLDKAYQTAVITHNHKEGIKGAQAVASAVFFAKNGKSKAFIKDFIIKKFRYDLDFRLSNIRENYKFDVTCQGSVPQAIVAFLESRDYEDAVRLGISIGGDSDTIACITGGIASAFYKEIPISIIDFAYSRLPDEMIKIIEVL